MLLGAKRAGRGTVKKSNTLTVAPHKLQSNKGDLESHLESTAKTLFFPVSFFAEAECAFLLGPRSCERWTWACAGPKDHPFRAD